MSDMQHRRDIKSYVVRGGRLTVSQQKALENYWPEYGLERNQGIVESQLLFGNDHPLVFEIGFGMGDSLVEMAAASPQHNFIGVDVHPPGIGMILRKIAERELGNVRVYQDDAKLVLAECMTDNSIDRVQIFFPDPWHKKRHHKRRLIQAAFIEELLPKLKTGGVLHLATDWQNYAEQMLEVLSGFSQLKNLATSGNFSTEHERPVTKFERRGERLGHGVWDLQFRKIS
ncbi:MAG: tRNA (guanosine(46)-N7)-methyltransferase TrmB [Gammaproteobacteria bacterium]|nr:tRNA (guanosine(46)-N7)-methyltransferase TrmB [Gammaproteobacteria bacterium]|tara:strand:- start:193 stop:879 length:687 start_codon:yes stop_codon:yes gene_type:complete